MMRVQGLTRNQSPADPLAITYLLQLLPRRSGGSSQHRLMPTPSLPHGDGEPPLAPTTARAAWRACLPCFSTRTLDDHVTGDKQSVVYTGAMAEQLPPIKEGAAAAQRQLPPHTAAIAASVVAADVGVRVARTALRRQRHAEQERCVAAAAAGDVQGVAQGLARGAEGDGEDHAGRTPVAAAAMLGHTEVLAKILSQVNEAGFPTADLRKCAPLPLHRGGAGASAGMDPAAANHPLLVCCTSGAQL